MTASTQLELVLADEREKQRARMLADIRARREAREARHRAEREREFAVDSRQEHE